MRRGRSKLDESEHGDDRYDGAARDLHENLKADHCKIDRMLSYVVAVDV